MGKIEIANSLKTIGRAIPRTDYRAKITGAIPYPSDVAVEGMLESAIVHSPFAHAEIESIDISAAIEVPGVICVLTRDDLKELDPYFGPVFRDQPILAIDRVRYEGEPVVAIVAVDRKTAHYAASLVEVEYHPHPEIDNLEAALEPNAPLVQSYAQRGSHYSKVLADADPRHTSNVAFKWDYDRGNVVAGMATADLIIENEYRVPIIHHFPLEPIHTVAKMDSEGITVWTGTQTPMAVRQDLAVIFGCPQSKIQVVSFPMGGSFGAKAFSKVEPLAVALARKAGKPVRVALSMSETARTIRRAGARVKIKSGVNRDGTLVARKVEIDYQIGAYADCAPRVAQKGGYVSAGPYRIPNLEIRSRAIYSNTPPSGAYRGFGVPQATWAYEQHTDELAKALGMDAIEFRLKNMLERGESYAEGDTPIDTDYAPVLRELANELEWDQPLKPWRGRGVAVSFKPSQAPTESTAIVRLHADGSVSVLMGTAEMGQGSNSAMAQIAAEEINIPLERVVVTKPDTAMVPFDSTTTASRSTVAMGRAVQNAARDIKSKLLKRAAILLKESVDNLIIENGEIVFGQQRLTIPEILYQTKEISGIEIISIGQFILAPTRSPIGGSTPFWEPCWVATEVEVDPNTGRVKVCRLLTAVDAGKAINLQQVEGQDIGSSMQGIGAALYEQMIFESGVLSNPSLVQYRVPLFMDVPDDFRSKVIENEDGPGPFGAKGVGEGGLMAVPAAIGNAVAQAIGTHINQLPLTPERVWRAITKKEGSET
ncbi:xanthine dehydrogenase [Bacillus canaveralius]|uniref:Xanthine dehydrogenase n=1 Tax=Bacillus canaveralius TaxID=1403243 RepID=A0A2N5GMA3_9BACI|nr:xanthine dehydrogenase family protein molybdopterin-binding subunit [Bacillus canaveralius]PLR82992.1 xanthine dehydrogenase [Bacillus canaveralius]PLR97004.1 xanthine dehydrogenase [Bacillus canaveralius]